MGICTIPAYIASVPAGNAGKADERKETRDHDPSVCTQRPLFLRPAAGSTSRATVRSGAGGTGGCPVLMRATMPMAFLRAWSTEKLTSPCWPRLMRCNPRPCGETGIFLAAPVSGNGKCVKAGKLSQVASGPRAAYDEVEAMLKIISSRDCIPGSRMKVCRNCRATIAPVGTLVIMRPWPGRMNRRSPAAHSPRSTPSASGPMTACRVWPS